MPRFFHPILAGATWRDRAVAALGALAAIAVTALATALLIGAGAPMLIVAPMGASAVLVFAVPASPLAQPWPVIGGNLLSALVGVAAAQWVPMPALASSVAVGGAILVMSLTRCLHPPGGAAALLAVVGGPAVSAAGFSFALVPVGLNAAILTAAGLLFHRASGHAYPHRAAPVPAGGATPEDIDRALADMGETLDIDPADLAALVRRVEHHSAARRSARRR